MTQRRILLGYADGILTLRQNGNYQNPPRVKRAFRDPYGGWWDQQEKRNFGEPVHEENEILGVFSPEQYTHVTPRRGFFHLGVFVATFLGLCGVVSLYYPDKPSVPKTYESGLEKELGGPNAVPVRSPTVCIGIDVNYQSRILINPLQFRLARLVRIIGD